MSKRVTRVMLLAMALSLVSCGHRLPHATVLYMHERELGGSLFGARILVNHRFVRIDPDVAAANYILFNRRKKVIYSVDVTDHTILVIRDQPVTLTAPIVFQNRVQELPGSRKFNGHTARHYALFTNGEQCYELYAVKGFLPDAARALATYQSVLAGEQAIEAGQGSPELQGPCDLADNVFFAGREYALGFPVEITDHDGNEKILMRVERNVALNAGTFTLPPNYLRYSPNEIRNGG